MKTPKRMRPDGLRTVSRKATDVGPGERKLEARGKAHLREEKSDSEGNIHLVTVREGRSEPIRWRERIR